MILVTGGAGFIGSHLCVQLLELGHNLVILDNLSNSESSVIEDIKKIAGKSLHFIQGDVKDKDLLRLIFAEYEISTVFHCAGRKSVKESSVSPLVYYEENVSGLINILQVMKEYEIKDIIFSSSATVYGTDAKMPVGENEVSGSLANPYARTKRMCEHILEDMCTADKLLRVGILRYFNPIGAHSSGLIGERPSGVPNNLMPFIGKVVAGEYPFLSVYGDDYPTNDGSGVRDYIHIDDLVSGHICAMDYIKRHEGCNVWNLGTGIGYSVFEIVRAFEKASKRKVEYQIVARREGDVAASWADPRKALDQLGWKAVKTLDEMMADSWRWINASK